MAQSDQAAHDKENKSNRQHETETPKSDSDKVSKPTKDSESRSSKDKKEQKMEEVKPEESKVLESKKEPVGLVATMPMAFDFDKMTPEELEKTIKELELREQVLQNLIVSSVSTAQSDKQTARLKSAGMELANKEAELREKALAALKKMKPPVTNTSKPPASTASKLTSQIVVPKPVSASPPQTDSSTKQELDLRQKALQMLLQKKQAASVNTPTNLKETATQSSKGMGIYCERMD